MPRVGSSRISTFGFVSSHLLMTTFCWLPPESDDGRRIDRRGADAEPLRGTSRRSARSSARLTSPAGERKRGSDGSEMFDGDRERHDQAELAAVLGAVGDAERHAPGAGW